MTSLTSSNSLARLLNVSQISPPNNVQHQARTRMHARSHSRGFSLILSTRVLVPHTRTAHPGPDLPPFPLERPMTDDRRHPACPGTVKYVHTRPPRVSQAAQLASDRHPQKRARRFGARTQGSPTRRRSGAFSLCPGTYLPACGASVFSRVPTQEAVKAGPTFPRLVSPIY
ncbi:hypothetical protein PYCCODRAFT_1021780 [Trametes coccinea BRFM310]|uniref:Uncharacterized protein n=1 Tax=Trametes coccinea (strain BRFM310) TaxID=1353009 RepID=A0A1Y2IAJ8_TRAC3|nr:hypothetical protein PYCCODRAFT_1021780 [Trametes coccinea BRFM310]